MLPELQQILQLNGEIKIEVNWKYTSTGLGLLFLIAIGASIIPDDTHFCRDRFETGQEDYSMGCDRLSGTGSTCYPEENTTKGYRRCTSGWEVIDRNGEPSGGVVFNTSDIIEYNCAEDEKARVCVGWK